jgi:hypothetical protein
MGWPLVIVESGASKAMERWNVTEPTLPQRPTRMNCLLKILHYRNSVPTDLDQITRWQVSGGNELRENRLKATRDHLQCNGREHEAWYCRTYRGCREHAKE